MSLSSNNQMAHVKLKRVKFLQSRDYRTTALVNKINNITHHQTVRMKHILNLFHIIQIH